MLSIRNVTLIIVLAGFCLTSAAMAREVYVKDLGMVEVDNGQFIDLRDKMKPSSLIHRVFYDIDNQYLLVNLKGTFFQHCSIPQSVVDDWLAAASPGEYYLNNIKGNFDCGTNPAPENRK